MDAENAAEAVVSSIEVNEVVDSSVHVYPVFDVISNRAPTLEEAEELELPDYIMSASDEAASLSEEGEAGSAGEFSETGDLSISRDSLSTISEGSADLDDINGETLDDDGVSLSSQDSLCEDRKAAPSGGRKPPLQRAVTVTGAETAAPRGGGGKKQNGTQKSGIPRGQIPRPPLTKSKSGSDSSLASTTSNTTTTAASAGKNLPAIKETRASMARKQKLLHEQNHPPEPEDSYLTPMQKKDHLLKELRRETREVAARLEQREAELRDVVAMKDSEIGFLMNEKETEIQELGDSLREAEVDRKEAVRRQAEATAMLAECEKTIKDMETDRVKREAMHQEMYFKMYLKGQKSANFERQDELAKVAEENPEDVSVLELLEKLNTTQEELTKWQSLKRQELYAEAEKPETEADCMLRFLRDSMFHYLTERSDKDQAQHLRAMVGILGFTEVQLKRIAKAKEDNKKK